MQRVFIITLLCTFTHLLFAQRIEKESLVLISGKLIKSQDSTLISGNILYEKLPYYDDMGMVSVGANGIFNMYLVPGEKYNISIRKPGYLPFETVLSVSEQAIQNFYVKEDIIEISLKDLIFARGSDRISSTSYTALNNLVRWMNENPSAVIQLEGHTDFAGNAESNLKLSQARVEAVKKYLTDQKIKRNRIFTKAFGGTQPLSKERTDEAKSLNRRVEVRIIRR